MAFLTPLEPVTLTGHLVTLVPLAHDQHDSLLEALEDGQLWDRWYTSVPAPSGLRAEIDRRLELQEKGEMIPFTAIDVAGRVLGMTTYYDIDATVPRMEIGYTWNSASAHGTGTNADTIASKGAQAGGALNGLGDLIGGPFGQPSFTLTAADISDIQTSEAISAPK